MTEILVSNFIIVLLIFLRIISAFIAAPVFGHNSVPVLIKVVLSFIIAYIIFLVNKQPLPDVQITLWWLAVNAFAEIISGLIIGFSLNFVFYGISFAGSLIGFDMGLSIAQVFNPIEETDRNIIGEILYLSSILIFILLNGHHFLVRALDYSFTVIPLGKNIISSGLNDLIIKYSAGVFIIAVKIAAPVIITFLLIHIGEGIVSKVIPQMQIFFVAQPLKIGLGFFLIIVTCPLLFYIIKNLLKAFEDNLYDLIKVMGA
jgi:flagellar biosynthesis protein FliR